MDRERLWLLLPRQLRSLPADLAAVLALVVATNLAVFAPVVNETPLRVVVGLAFVLFAPGYAFVAALFPEAGEPPGARADGNEDAADGPTTASETPTETEAAAAAAGLQDRGIDGIERVALAFGLSIAIVPLLGLVLNFTPFGIRLVPILVAVSGFTAVATAVAAFRRWELPAEERFRVPYGEWLAAGKREVFEPDTQLDAALNVLLAVAVLLAVSSVAYAVAVPPQGEQFTEFYLLTEDGGDGDELVAAGYPETFSPGEPESLYVGIGNNEYETVEYAVVVQLQRVEGEGNESVVTERAEVDRWAATVGHNETWLEEREVALDGGLTGEELRLTFLLYDGEVPAEPTRENAYRSLHLWIEVEAGG